MPFSEIKRVEWAGVAAAVAFATVSYMVTKAYTDAEARVRKVVEVRREVDAARRAVGAAQRGQRGFLITGREDYLKPYEVGMKAAREHLGRLETLTADEPAQQTRVKRAAAESEVLFQELDKTVALVRSGKKVEAYSVVNTDLGETTVTQVMERLDDCARNEDDRLMAQSGETETLYRTSVTMIVLSAAGLTAAGIFAWQAYRRRRF